MGGDVVLRYALVLTSGAAPRYRPNMDHQVCELCGDAGTLRDGNPCPRCSRSQWTPRETSVMTLSDRSSGSEAAPGRCHIKIERLHFLHAALLVKFSRSTLLAIRNYIAMGRRTVPARPLNAVAVMVARNRKKSGRGNKCAAHATRYVLFRLDRGAGRSSLAVDVAAC